MKSTFFAIGFVARETLEGLKAFAQSFRLPRNQQSKVLLVAVAVVSLSECVLDGAVHQFNLAVSPGMVGFRQPVLDPIGIADYVQVHWPEMDGVPVPRLLSELNAVFDQDGVHLASSKC